MNTFELYEVNQLKAFDSKFSEYLSLLKKYIDQTDINEEKLEINKMYLKSIEESFENKDFNCDQYLQLKSVLKDTTFTRLKKQEIDAIIRVFIRKVNFETSTLEDRDVEKTLDITNEIYASLSKNIIKLNKIYNKKWNDISISFPETSTYSYFSTLEKNKENKDVKRDYEYQSKAIFDRG
ncbi:hypothetical protein [Enterococcus pallens]|uniref:Uncharacterized protein n=1 Tax=Enterococcus pallens ATCC BAA-351 TaxID=1158607 RepID=R2S1H5_9ENTE|nr:hypothetical protein [Enterococcus pallens]EOH86681.1 hypothetical protein UAU_05126 [Enterococcus pallens ATCC BAA-351]EOU18477.1 hypothetical protein I588_03471 [Enterococcus pallens ATCC BAA-351]OJG81213.1 hypothetical protein RV10_GL003341 [Enterococcus pallens]